MTRTLPQPKSSSVLVNALHQALELCLDSRGLNRQVEIFSYAQDFTVLWGLEAEQRMQDLSGGDFAIVVDDGWSVPNDLPEARKHLTALDWAVWLVLDRLENVQHRGVPSVIVLTKKNGPTVDGSSSDAARFWSIFPEGNVPALPWIRVVPIVSSKNQPCCLLRLLQIILEDPAAEVSGDISMVRQIWQSFFLRPTLPSDNHALANLLGTGLLTGNLGNSSTRRALMKFLQTLRLLPKAIGDRSTESPPMAIQTAVAAVYSNLPPRARRVLRLLLVDDDQARYAWSELLAQWLGLRCLSDGTWGGRIGKLETQLTTTDSADELLSALTSSRADADGLQMDSGQVVDILFLDLRLFERSVLKLEAAFFAKVIAELRSVNDAQPANPGDWPRVDEVELQRLDRWCKFAIDGDEHATRNDTQYIECLTLFPRLAAAIDPDLPIIVFSSTQRRRIADLLRPYGTIIQEFSKPPLQLGGPSQLADEARAGFERAVVESLKLVHARKMRRSLLEADFPVYWKGHVEKPMNENSDRPWSIQLLLDETERIGQLTVGGFLAIYPPHVCPSTVNDEIYAAYPNIRGKKEKNRNGKLDTALWSAIGILETHQVLLVPLALSGERNQHRTAHSSWYGSSAFRDELVADNLHRELVRCLIELGLFVFARQVLPESAQVEFYLHAPTRVLPICEDQVTRLNWVWGIHCWKKKSGKWFATHSDHSTARALLEEVFREYRGSVFEPEPVRARAFGLSDNAAANEKHLVYALHYLADGWLYDHSSPELSQLREVAIEGDYGPALARLLQAHRYLLHGQTARAVAIGAQTALGLKPSQRSTAINCIVAALQDAVRSMTGTERASLASILTQIQPANANQELTGYVTSISDVNGSVEIEWRGKVFHAAKRQVKTPVSIGAPVLFQPRRGNRLGSLIAQNVRTFENESDVHELP